ncbi:hypothetical protein V8F33_013956 [Rhypophila sp. PSN 637]
MPSTDMLSISQTNPYLTPLSENTCPGSSTLRYLTTFEADMSNNSSSDLPNGDKPPHQQKQLISLVLQMYLIKAAEDFRTLVESVDLYFKNFVRRRVGFAVPFASQPELLLQEIKDVIKAYYTDENKRERFEQHIRRRRRLAKLRRELGLIYLKKNLSASARVRILIVVPTPSGEGPKTVTTDEVLELDTTVVESPRFKIVIRKSAGEENILTDVMSGDIVQLDEDEDMQVRGKRITLMILEYDVEDLVDV